jgi:hypothetical protein
MANTVPSLINRQLFTPVGGDEASGVHVPAASVKHGNIKTTLKKSKHHRVAWQPNL